MNIEKQIEFDKIKKMWEERAITEFVKIRIRELSFYLSESELRKQLKDTTDSRIMLEQLGMPSLPNVEEEKSNSLENKACFG